MKLKSISAVFISLIVIAAYPQDKFSTSDFEKTLDTLLKICLAHPEFNPTSIDDFKKSKALDYQKAFYEKSNYFYSREGTDFLLDKRKDSKNQATVQCIDKILNTLPG